MVRKERKEKRKEVATKRIYKYVFTYIIYIDERGRRKEMQKNIKT